MDGASVGGLIASGEATSNGRMFAAGSQEGNLVWAGDCVAPIVLVGMGVPWMALVPAGDGEAEVTPGVVRLGGRHEVSSNPRHRIIRGEIFTMRDSTMQVLIGREPK